MYLIHFEPVSLLLESQRSETSSKADNPTSTLLSMDLVIFSRSRQRNLKEKKMKIE